MPRLLYYYILLQRNYILQSLFFTVFLFVVRFSPAFCSVLRHLLVQAFRIVPSRPMPSPVQTSKSKLLYIKKDPLDGAASFIPLTVLQIKDLPRCWTRWTNGLYRGPTQEKNYFAPGGNWTSSQFFQDKSFGNWASSLKNFLSFNSAWAMEPTL